MHRSFVVFVLCATLTACARKPELHPNIQQFVIAVDGDGRAVNAKKSTSNPNAGDPSQKGHAGEWTFDAQLQEIFDSMDEFHRRRDPAGPQKILLYVHGGLTEPDGSLAAASRDFRDITEHFGADFYPIFINWDSGFISSYGEHLFDVRRGRKDRSNVIIGPLTAPLELLADLGRAVARAPLVWLYQIERDVQSAAASHLLFAKQRGDNAWLDHPRLGRAVQLLDHLYDRYKKDPADEINISIGNEEVSRRQAAARFGMYALTLPAKFATSPIIDGGGSPAWDNMSRRTLMMFEGAMLDQPRKSRGVEENFDHRPGDVQVFAERLAAHIREQQYEVTVIAHSMGTMVMNEFIRRNPELPYRDVVYMGAACTVRDFARSVVPLLESERDVRFYNLCLHPLAELRETNVHDIPPRGSLLVWIDDFFSNPATPLDRTLGRWENVVDCWWVIPEEVRGRVGIKAFDLKVDYEAKAGARYNDPAWTPQKHGQFRSAVRYWERSYWQPAPPPEDDQMKEIREKAQQLTKQQALLDQN